MEMGVEMGMGMEMEMAMAMAMAMGMAVTMAVAVAMAMVITGASARWTHSHFARSTQELHQNTIDGDAAVGSGTIRHEQFMTRQEQCRQ